MLGSALPQRRNAAGVPSIWRFRQGACGTAFAAGFGIGLGCAAANRIHRTDAAVSPAREPEQARGVDTGTGYRLSDRVSGSRDSACSRNNRNFRSPSAGRSAGSSLNSGCHPSRRSAAANAAAVQGRGLALCRVSHRGLARCQIAVRQSRDPADSCGNRALPDSCDTERESSQRRPERRARRTPQHRCSRSRAESPRARRR